MSNFQFLSTWYFLLFTFCQNIVAFQVVNLPRPTQIFPKPYYSTTKINDQTIDTTSLSMGLFDFFSSRKEDFVKLDTTQSAYGPGPIILCCNVPDGISTEELYDMIEDGAPSAFKKYQDANKAIPLIQRFNVSPSDLENDGDLWMDGTVEEMLEKAIGNTLTLPKRESSSTPFVQTVISDEETSVQVPILYFSGISNEEMMATYNIIASEIYQETNGVAKAACAKVVEPAMGKPFRQLIGEIMGDHLDAIGAS